MKRNKIEEGLEMDMTTYKKVKGTLDPKTPIKITGDKPATSSTSSSMMEEDDSIEPEAVITPQDDATIKYLSNVKDNKTGKISLPFIINNAKYRMVRAMTPSKEIIMGVGCIDESDKDNVKITHVHTIEEFEKNIVKPVMEKEIIMQKEAMFGGDIEAETKPKVEAKKEQDSLNLGEFKHFMVNEKSGKFRKFKNIVELASAVMNEDEKYMPIKEFRKYFESKVFGSQKKNINEIDPIETDTKSTNINDLKSDTKKLVDLIKQRFEVPLSKLDKEIEKAQFLESMAEILGLDITKLPSLISNLKTIVKTPNSVNEKKVMTKAELTESLLKPNVIKTIKVKNIK